MVNLLSFKQTQRKEEIKTPKHQSTLIHLFDLIQLIHLIYLEHLLLRKRLLLKEGQGPGIASWAMLFVL
jgi:hypothetical protein